MAIRLMTPRTRHKVTGARATVLELIQETIFIGKKQLEIANDHNYFHGLRTKAVVGDIIRKCNNFLGVGKSSKNGCLYREEGLPEFCKDEDNTGIVCEHAVPVKDLVDAFFHGERLEKLIFYPVVRITKESDMRLNKEGRRYSGCKNGLPLYRYSGICNIVTHTGKNVTPETWSDEDHWNLVKATQELQDILIGLKLV